MIRRLQRVAFYLVIVCGVLILGTVAGCSVLPSGATTLSWLFHPLLLALGTLCGYASVVRNREIEENRWRVVDDDSLTSGERAWAHREAGLETRRAGTAFFLAAISVGGLLAYQLHEPGVIGPGDLLMVTPFAGFLIGLVIGVRRLPSPEPRF